MFCFDTDILATVVRRDPPLGVIRRLAVIAPSCQFTTSISYGELFYSAARQESEDLAERVRGLLLYSAHRAPVRRRRGAALRPRTGFPRLARETGRGARSPYRRNRPSAVRSSS